MCYKLGQAGGACGVTLVESQDGQSTARLLAVSLSLQHSDSAFMARWFAHSNLQFLPHLPSWPVQQQQQQLLHGNEMLFLLHKYPALQS